ncbi:MAG TPA: tRNA epoxyqueuosine(34) reductase QueG [Candidatus Dormibacteraeota bacterium]
MDRQVLKRDLVAEARRLGFVAAGVTSARPFGRARKRALRAIEQGRMDGMAWYTRERVDAAADLRARYPWARSILALAWPYAPAAQPTALANREAQLRPDGLRGRMSAYACLAADGRRVDYHDLLAARCDDLAEWLQERSPGSRAKRFIDHGWALDRAVAERAGLGFSGKHSQLITREAGSYVLLAEIVLSVSLPADSPSKRSCGRCTACMPACPTGAIVAPGVIDARRCIAYLTIEHRGAIAHELRPLMGTWVFGCDLCQEACPINHRRAPAAIAAQPASTAAGPVPFPDLVECLALSDDAFRTRFRTTAVWRTGRAGLARNCAVALGNLGDPAAVPHLERARDTDPDPVVREAADWALARLSAAASA